MYQWIRSPVPFLLPGIMVLLIKLRPKILFNITTEGTFTPIPVQKKLAEHTRKGGLYCTRWREYQAFILFLIS